MASVQPCLTEFGTWVHRVAVTEMESFYDTASLEGQAAARDQPGRSSERSCLVAGGLTIRGTRSAKGLAAAGAVVASLVVKTGTDPAAPDTTPAPASDGRRHRRWAWIGAAAVAATGVVVFVLVWFEPHTLFIDDRVDQDVPTAGPTTTAPPEPDQPVAQQPSGSSDPGVTTTAPAGPVDLGSGSFVSLDHATSGNIRLIELADGRRFVRLEGFETDNGPDLFVYLSTNTADGPEGAFDDDYADLGRLQGNIGDQNYEIPGDVDPARYASVVIWCDRFDAAFGAADLTTRPS